MVVKTIDQVGRLLKLNIEEIITNKLVENLINSTIFVKFALLRVIFSRHLQ